MCVCVCVCVMCACVRVRVCVCVMCVMCVCVCVVCLCYVCKIKIYFLRFCRRITSELQRPVLCREVVALCSESHIKPFSTRYGSNVMCFNVQAGDTCSGHHAFK